MPTSFEMNTLHHWRTSPCVIKTQWYGYIWDSGGSVETPYGTSVGCEKGGKVAGSMRRWIKFKSNSTFFTPYGGSVGGFNTTSRVPYIAIPLSFDNTRTCAPMVKCIYLPGSRHQQKQPLFQPFWDFSHPMVARWGVSALLPESRIQPYL